MSEAASRPAPRLTQKRRNEIIASGLLDFTAGDIEDAISDLDDCRDRIKELEAAASARERLEVAARDLRGSIAASRAGYHIPSEWRGNLNRFVAAVDALPGGRPE